MRAALVKCAWSVTRAGCVSLRALDGTGVQRAITSAGFQPEQILVVLPLSEIDQTKLPPDAQAELRLALAEYK